MIRKFSQVGILFAACIVAGESQKTYAGPALTLNDLLNGASLKVGDLVFSNFGNFGSLGFSGGKAVDPKLVTVSAMFYNGAPGLVFQSASQFLVGMGQQQDTHFTFKVTAPTSLIKGAALSFTAAAYGGGFAKMAQTMGNLPNGLLVSTLIPQNYMYGQLTEPLSSITISKDISLVGGKDQNALTFLGDFSQSFTSTGGGGGGATPEPASVTLLAMGLVALAGYRWRTRFAQRTVTT